MKREYVDFHFIPEHLLAVHHRLLNWARWVRVHHTTGWIQNPMWRHAVSNSRQWHPVECRGSCDLLDAEVIEHAVRKLEQSQRFAVRWMYVDGSDPRGMSRRLGMTPDRMRSIIHQAMGKIDAKYC